MYTILKRWRLISVIVVVLAIIGIASRFFFKKTDNVIEELTEKVIFDKTGYDVDLSPDTPDASDML